MKTKVLHYVAVMNRGGQETFIMNVFRSIDRSKYEFGFLCCLREKGDYDEEIEKLGGHVLHVSLCEKDGKLKQIDNFFRLYKYLKNIRYEYDIFHIHTQHAMDAYRDALAAKLAGIKQVVVHSHSTSTLFHIKAHHLFKGPLNRMRVTRLACSDAAGKWLYGEDGDFQVINNGIDLGKYVFDDTIRNELRDSLGWNSKYVVGHVGSFTYPKNHKFMLSIFKQVLVYNSDAILALVGRGPMEEEVREQIKSLGIEDNVVLLGSRSDVEKFDQAFDVMLFPSHYEGLPVTLVEAQATGLSCVISDVITNQIDITENIIRLNLKDSVDVWARKVIDVEKKDRKIYNELVAKSGFGIDTTIEQLMSVYSK